MPRQRALAGNIHQRHAQEDEQQTGAGHSGHRHDESRDKHDGAGDVLHYSCKNPKHRVPAGEVRSQARPHEVVGGHDDGKGERHPDAAEQHQCRSRDQPPRVVAEPLDHHVLPRGPATPAAGQTALLTAICLWPAFPRRKTFSSSTATKTTALRAAAMSRSFADSGTVLKNPCSHGV